MPVDHLRSYVQGERTEHRLDQAALHGLLQKVRDTDLPLVSVTPLDL